MATRAYGHSGWKLDIRKQDLKQGALQVLFLFVVISVWGGFDDTEGGGVNVRPPGGSSQSHSLVITIHETFTHVQPIITLLVLIMTIGYIGHPQPLSCGNSRSSQEKSNMATGSAIFTRKSRMPKHQLWAKVETLIKTSRKGIRKPPGIRTTSTRTYLIPTATGDRFELTVQIYPARCKIEFDCNGLTWAENDIHRDDILKTLTTLLSTK